MRAGMVTMSGVGSSHPMESSARSSPLRGFQRDARQAESGGGAYVRSLSANFLSARIRLV